MGTWPSRSRCQTAETTGATTPYTLRDRAAGVGSENQTQWRSAARIATSLASGSNGISSAKSSFPAPRGFIGVQRGQQIENAGRRQKPCAVVAVGVRNVGPAY